MVGAGSLAQGLPSSQRVLLLRRNPLRTLPRDLFVVLPQLERLDVHETSVMVDTLREMEGWGGVEERRRARADKQVDSGVVGWAEGKAWDQGGGVRRHYGF